MRRCILCRKHKPDSAFHRRWKGKDALQSKCKDCDKRTSLDRVHGKGATAWKKRQLHKQGGRCAACGTTDPKHAYGWALDHCHKTGTWRHVLCHNCNLALGLIERGWEIDDFVKFVENKSYVT